MYRSSTDESKKIALRYKLLQYDAAKTPEEKKPLLDQLASVELGLRFEHSRPGNLPLKASIKESDKKMEIKVEEEKALLDEVNIMAEITKLYSREKRPSDFTKSLLAKVDFEKLRKEEFLNLLQTMGDDIVMIDTEQLYKTYAKVLADGYKINKYYGVDPGILRNMTIEQMEKLRAKLPGLSEDATFAGIYSSKKFSRELSEEENSHLTYMEKRANLIKMYEYAKTLPHKLSGLKSSLLLEILENGLKVNIYDEAFFGEYIKQPARDNFMKKPVAPDTGSWKDHIQNVQVEHNRVGYAAQLRDKDKELLTKYLQHYFLEGKKVDTFSEYLELRFLVGVWEDTMLTSGQKIEFSPENSARLEKLATEVTIQISERNKDVFGIGEEISLFVDIKNVPTLFIKVFEINTENYYRKSMSPFRTDVNLDGLIASYERSAEYKLSPQIKFTEELKFPELKGKVGLFVIELIGNGKSSRAVLKIGTLSVITRPTVVGQICYILDGERKVCCHETTGIWMDNQFFKANVTKGGKIIVPFIPSGGSRTPKAILLHQGLAQLVDFNRMEESYSLQCGFFLLPESVIMGKIATIVVRPQLLINGRQGDIGLLKNIRCVLYSSNYTDNIPSTKNYSNLTLSDNSELLIKFQVGANLKDLRIDFSADIMNISKDTKQTLNAQHQFEFATHTDDCAIAELYLRMTPGKGYELALLGKNGEPIANNPVEFVVAASDFTYPSQLTGTTNEKGTINLGKLNGVRQISASLRQSSGKVTIGKTWVLPSETIMQYPTFIDIIEDEAVELPVGTQFISQPFYLRGMNNVMTLGNFSGAVKVEQEKGALYGIATIKGLKSGTYILTGFGKERITLRVHKGAYWAENQSYILKQYSLLENTEKQGFVKIKSVNFEEEKDGKARMKVSIVGATKNQRRVHVIFFRYLPENLNELSFRMLSRDMFVGSEYYFQKWTNFYLSNRELSSEFRYCFDRRNEHRFTGNTLDKPKLLLKRTLVQATQTQRETWDAGTAYQHAEERARAMPQQYYAQQQQMIPQAANYYPQMQQMAMAPSSYVRGPSRGYGSAPYHAGSSPDRIPLFQNFLGLEPLTVFNLEPNEDGTLIVELDKNYKDVYACALVLAVDKGSVAHYLHPLSGSHTIARDLSLTKALDVEKAYSEMRTTKCVEKFDTYTIDDITSSDIQIIDSLEKVMMILKELIRLQGLHIADLDKFEKLVLWDNMKEEDKDKMMSRYTSHELHLFIYKKDPAYFNKVVKKYLENKMEKTFIDYYLLNNLKEMLVFAENPSLQESLNPMERALLIEGLILGGKKEIAVSLTQRMRDALLAHKKTTAEINRIFDTVLSLNALKTAKDDIQKMMKSEDEKGMPPGGPPPPPMSAMGFGGSMRNEALQPPDEMMLESMEMQQNQMMDFEGEGANMFSNSIRSRPAPKMAYAAKKAAMFDEDDVSSTEAIRIQQRKSLEELGETKEYAETHYYGLTLAKNWRNQVSESEYWADYAEYVTRTELKDGKPSKQFITFNFTGAYHNLTEVIGAITLLDLPYRSADHGFKTLEGRSAELKAASNLVVFKKEIKESKGETRNNILVAQRYIDWEDRGDEDAKIEEYLVNHIYIGQVIMTNISSRKVEFDVLVQIPQGSLPVGYSPYQKSHSLSLNSYSTTKLEYQFYFPFPGKFVHFPASVSINSAVVAKATTGILTVLKEKTKISEENFREVVSSGDYTLILNFIRDRPIDGIKGFMWTDLYWLLKDIKFFEPFANLLKKQHRFEPNVWAYSLYHKNDEKFIFEYLNSLDYFKSKCGYYFDSKLLVSRPIDSGMRHLDYYPLVNPRAHKSTSASSTGANPSGNPLILNSNLYLTYKMFILYLIEKPVWELADKMNLAYYLCLQERVTEALKAFSSIDPAKDFVAEGTPKLQYDYMSAYLDFYVGAPDFKTARKIVAEYINYPVITWRLLFLDMDQQLKEYDGINIEEDSIEEEERKEIGKKKQIKTEPQLSITLEGKEVVVDYNSLTEATVKYYVIDLEILFSRTPFLAQNTEDFSFVKPDGTETVTLDPKMKEHRIPIPAKYSARNVVIEVNSGGLQKLVTYFSTSLKLQIFENYGELKATDEAGKQLPQVYVKAFVMKNDGTVSFYKDGYTDIRGRFDYVSLNASQLANAKKFALFIMSDKYGSLIRECQPPPTTIRQEEELGPVKSRVANYYKKSQEQQFSKCQKPSAKKQFLTNENISACLLYTSPSPRDRG
eukprot:TRINITY_DN1213_c0_g1_i6.p1 TRINITY_DN1213_c0_g1~~TRINITY_DN1213_c0_g1_i6.p1  ORF type:complete len:2229 (-),score=458.73 TRINITY_DN1213_c0_g1_i6:107-6793(-)